MVLKASKQNIRGKKMRRKQLRYDSARNCREEIHEDEETMNSRIEQEISYLLWLHPIPSKSQQGI